MNEPTPNPSEEGNRTAGGRLGWQVAGMFAGAVLLGAVYNSASPLGVRTAKPSGAGEPQAATVTAPPKSPVVRTGYFNETLSMSLEEPGAVAPAAVAPAVPSPTPAIKSLTWAQVKPLLDAGRIILVDARKKANYDVAHIPGAVSLPSTSSATEVQAFAARYPKTTGFVVYCSSESCHNSRELAESLMVIGGCTDVSEMPGGFAEYRVAQPLSAQAKP